MLTISGPHQQAHAQSNGYTFTFFDGAIYTTFPGLSTPGDVNAAIGTAAQVLQAGGFTDHWLVPLLNGGRFFFVFTATPVFVGPTLTGPITIDVFGAGSSGHFVGVFSDTGANANVDGTETFVGTETTPSGASVSINCTLTANNSFSGQCGDLATLFFGNAISGAGHATARNQVDTSLKILSNRIQAISQAAGFEKAGGLRSDDQPRLRYTGLSAGSKDLKWGVWLDGTGSYLSNSGNVAQHEGFGTTMLSGVDYLYDNTWLFGFDVGYAHTDIKLNAIIGNRVADTGQAGPYISYIINEHFSIDGSATYAHVFNTVTTALFQPTLSSTFETDRYSAATNFNAYETVGNFLLTGFVGYVFAYESEPNGNGLTATGIIPPIHYSSVKLGGEAAYDIGNFEPYIPLTLSYETTDPRDGTGQRAVEGGIGVRYKIGDQLRAGLQVITEQRSHSQTGTASFNLRYVF